MQNAHAKNLSALLSATLFISTSGVLGKYINMPPEAIIFCRAGFAAVLIFIFCKIKNITLKVNSKKDRFSFIISGVLLGAHWVSYFYALKLSNVALGMLSMYTFPIITVFLEPFFFKKRLSKVHVFLAVLVFFGVYLLVPEVKLDNTYFKGILLGILSALFYALRNLIVQKDVKNYNGSVLMVYQMVVVTVVLLPVLYISDLSNFTNQWPFLILIALLTTAIGHTLMVNALQHFTATTTSIISSVQPIFGIVIAYFFINEIPSVNTAIGGSLILCTVIVESIRNTKNKP